MFALRLKELREGKGISQKTFAIDMHFAQSTIGMWESGKREPDFETLCKIANYFNVTLDYLVGRADTPTPVPQTAQSAETEIQAEFNKLTESEQKDVLDYIRFKKHRRPEAKGLKELDAEIMEQNISRAAFTPSVPDFTDESEEFMNKKNSPSKD